MRRLVYLPLLLSFGCMGMADPADVEDGPAPGAPDVERSTVAMGVARLTVRTAAALLKALDDDKTCGFSSDAAKASLWMSGKAGDDGLAQWTVTNCVVNFAPDQLLHTDCDGVKLTASGRVTVSATRVVRGVLTQDPAQPVAPDAADAVTLSLHAELDGFTVRQSNSDASITVNSGELSVRANPQLMPDRTTGICTEPTPQAALHELKLTGAQLDARAQGRTLQVPVPSLSIEAQIGAGADHENWLAGKVTVWETNITVPLPSDMGGLDPAYTRDAFVHSYACDANLQQPLGGACPPPRERPAQGAAALSVSLFGAVTGQIEQDAHCGFASPSVMSAGTTMGNVGSQGERVWTLPAPCTLTFPPGTVVQTDCSGHQTVLEGAVTVTGRRTLKGWLTGDTAEPVVPASSTPATLELTLEGNNLQLSQPGAASSLLFISGSMSGTLVPKTGLDTTTGACSIATPVAHLMLSHQNAAMEIHQGNLAVALELSASSLEAQSGSDGSKTNYLAGQVTADGRMMQVPSAGAAPVLDPAYDAATFQASFACDANLKLPASEGDCSFARTLAEGAARALVRDAAAAVQLVNDDSTCGFQNQTVLTMPTSVTGNTGQEGEMVWTAWQCGVGPGARQELSHDCNQVVTTVEGTASVSATRDVTGMRDQVCGGFLNLTCADSIHPDAPGAVSFNLQASVSDFGAGTADGQLIVHTGTLSSVVQTVMGRSVSTGEYKIATPVAGFDPLTLSGARVSLQAGKKTFSFMMDANLKALSGGYRAQSNWLSGTVSVDGQSVDVGTLPLQPGYDQHAFDSSYVCTPDLAAVVDPTSS